MRDPVRKLVSCGGVRNPRRDRQHFSQKLAPILVLAQIETFGSAVEQIFEVRLRRAQALAILIAPLTPDERVRVLSLVEHEDVDIETFRNEELARSNGSAEPGGIGIEAEDHLGSKSAEQLRLVRRQCRATGGDSRSCLRLKHLCKIEVPLH